MLDLKDPKVLKGLSLEGRRESLPEQYRGRKVLTDKSQAARFYIFLVWKRIAAHPGSIFEEHAGWIWLGDLPERIDGVRVGDQYSIVKNVYVLRQMGFKIEERTKEGHLVSEFRMDWTQAIAEWRTGLKQLFERGEIRLDHRPALAESMGTVEDRGRHIFGSQLS